MSRFVATASAAVLLLTSFAHAGDWRDATVVSTTPVIDCTVYEALCAPTIVGTAELNMVELQSLVAQRQLTLQLTTGMLKSLGDCDICDNIGR
ncbi:MAG: hypothetical protein JWR75_638 [Devosia sp.]|nr:hypothetical protein [Devosia sp.]